MTTSEPPVVPHLKKGEGTTAGAVDPTKSKQRHVTFKDEPEVMTIPSHGDESTLTTPVFATTVKNDEVESDDESEIEDYDKENLEDLPDIPFQKDQILSMFTKRNYKVSASWGINSKSLRPKTVVLDTGARPNLVDYQAIPDKWKKRIKPIRNVKMTSASNQKMDLVGVIPLIVRIGDLKTRVWFGVCLLYTSPSPRDA